MSNSKGCVYFFRHIGLSPVKIGYSSYASPKYRFETFKTYAPYGAEMLGFIMTEDPKSLESMLHVKFKDKRLAGEWFEVTDSDVNIVISLHSKMEDIKRKSDFMKAWMEEVHPEPLENLNAFNGLFSKDKTDQHPDRFILNQGDLIRITEIGRDEIRRIMKLNDKAYKSYRNGDNVKQGYELFCDKRTIDLQGLEPQ